MKLVSSLQLSLIQTFRVNTQNELTNITRSGTLTMAGAFGGNPTSVTVNGLAATVYADDTFARAGFRLVDGVNTFTAIAQDPEGRSATNPVSANQPASVDLGYYLKGLPREIDQGGGRARRRR